MFITGLFVGFASTCVVVIVAYLLCAASADEGGETVDEWGKPDWVGKEVRK